MESFNKWTKLIAIRTGNTALDEAAAEGVLELALEAIEVPPIRYKHVRPPSLEV